MIEGVTFAIVSVKEAVRLAVHWAFTEPWVNERSRSL